MRDIMAVTATISAAHIRPFLHAFKYMNAEPKPGCQESHAGVSAYAPLSLEHSFYKKMKEKDTKPE
jgi:hypothetical protein